nr:MAG TPA: hypothetical protein [Caudoviricetes sp.]
MLFRSGRSGLKTSDLSDKLMVEKDEFIGVTDKLPNVSQRRH